MKCIKPTIKDQLSDFPFFNFIVIGLCIIALIIIHSFFDCSKTAPGTIKDILIAVLASYFFVLSLNFQRPLIINDYLVIRRRESQEGRPLSISLLVGCPWKAVFGSAYDLKCTFVYSIKDGTNTNSAFSQCQTREWIDHHFRFSFEIKGLEKDTFLNQFWTDFVAFIDNPDNKNENKITVIISGSPNRLGGHFRLKKQFDVEHILIGQDCIGALVKKSSEDANPPDILKDEVDIEKFENSPCFKLDKHNHYWDEFKHCRVFKESGIIEIKDMLKKQLVPIESSTRCNDLLTPS